MEDIVSPSLRVVESQDEESQRIERDFRANLEKDTDTGGH